MPIKRKIALQQIERFAALPYYPAGNDVVLAELAAALMHAESDAQACNTVSAILGDVARASSATTNRVPSPGEIRAWLDDEKDKTKRYWRSPDPPQFCRRCGGNGQQGIYGLTIDQIAAHPTGGMATCEMCSGTGQPGGTI